MYTTDNDNALNMGDTYHNKISNGEIIHYTYMCLGMYDGTSECAHSIPILVLRDIDTYQRETLVSVHTHTCAW